MVIWTGRELQEALCWIQSCSFDFPKNWNSRMSRKVDISLQIRTSKIWNFGVQNINLGGKTSFRVWVWHRPTAHAQDLPVFARFFRVGFNPQQLVFVISFNHYLLKSSTNYNEHVVTFRLSISSFKPRIMFIFKFRIYAESFINLQLQELIIHHINSSISSSIHSLWFRWWFW